MAEEKDDFLKFFTPSRREAVFPKKTKTVKVQSFSSYSQDTQDAAEFEELLERTKKERDSAMSAAGSKRPSKTLGNVTADLIDNTLKKAHSRLSDVDKETFEAYACELTEAQTQVNFADAAWAVDPCNLEEKQQLDESVLRLQGLVLQGPPSFRIMMESLKDLSQQVDLLISTNVSCATENQEINNICREIKIAADRVLEPYNAREKGVSTITHTDDTISDFLAIEQATYGHMEAINIQIQKLPDSNDKIILQSQFLSLESKHIILSFAAQSVIAANRLAFLNDNYQDILNVEDKINQMSLLGNITNHTIYSPKATPCAVQSNLLKAMFSLVSQRHLGTALMQYMDDLQSVEHTAQCCIQRRFQEHLIMLINLLKSLLMMTCRRVIHWKDYPDYHETSLVKQVLEEVDNVCICLSRQKTISWQEIDFDLLTVGIITFLLDKDEEKKIEDLQEWATQTTLSLVRDIDFMYTGVRATNKFISIQEVAKYLAWTAQTLKRPNDPVYNASIEKAVKDIIFETIKFAELYVLTKPMQQEQIAVSRNTSHYDIPIFHETRMEEEIVDIQQTRMQAGAVKVRPATSTAYTASAVEVGGTSRVLEELTPPDFLYETLEMLESHRGVFLDSSPHIILSSERYKTAECAGKYSEPVYLAPRGSGGSSGEGSGGGTGESSGGGIGGSSGGHSGMGSMEDSAQGDVQSSSASVSSPSDPTPISVNHIRFLNACQLINEAINNLCRIASQNRMRVDCGELLRNLLLQQALLQSRLPTCALSYEECLHALECEQELIPMLNSEEAMPMVAFWRTLRFISSAVCKSSELAAQCAYLILVSEVDPDAPCTGVVDVSELQNVLKVAQDTCYKMLTLQPEQAKEESFRLIRQVQHIVKALTDAGMKVRRLKAEFDFNVLEVHKCAMELSGSFEQSYGDAEGEVCLNYQERITAATTQMLNRLKAVNELTEHPGLTPAVAAAGTVSNDAQRRCDQVLRAAKYLTHSTLSLVYDVKNRSDYVDNDESIRWSAFELKRMEVVSAFEGLLNDVRRNCQFVGILS